MAWVTKDFIEKWYAGDYTGENTPHAIVQVQLGHWVREWMDPWPRPDLDFLPSDAPHRAHRVRADIWGEGGYGPDNAQKGHWAAAWHASTGWTKLPNLVSIKRTKDFQAKGVQVVEIVLDALDYVPKEGALGDAYHIVAPGWLAPTRAYVSPHRGRKPWQREANESPWAPLDGEARLQDSVAIRVWQGLGKPETDEDGNSPPVGGGSNGAWTFRGMIDDVDVDGDPNQITVTARNGKLLTDQRLFRASKSVQLKDPITFYDRQAAKQQTPVGFYSSVSSFATGHPGSAVLDRAKDDWNPDDAAYKTYWESRADVTGDHLEWVEIRLPRGTYDQIWMVSEPGQMAYVGLYAEPLDHWERTDERDDLHRTQTAPTKDGEPIGRGWVGGHTAPGGSYTFLQAFRTGSTAPTLPAGDGRVIDNLHFNNVYELGENSLLRVGMTRPSGSAHAKVHALFGMRAHGVQSEIRKEQFILVDDATEMIKVVLRWAGYLQWDIEDALVRLSDGTNYGPGVVAKSSGRLVFNRSNYLMDVVDELAKQLGWVFFIADPTDANSEGVPTFRRDASLVQDNSAIAANLTEDMMLTGFKVKHSDESKPYIIRVRGKAASARGGGRPLGGDSVTRLMATYFPEWAFGSRAGGILRHIVYQDDQIVTYAQCLYGAMLIAQNAALAMHTGVAEIPGHPMLELDDQVSVVDEATGYNGRLWVIKTEDTMTLGENASWTMTVEGSLLDTRDLQEIVQQIRGKKPIQYGSDNKTLTLRHINWRRIKNPASGRYSGWMSPVSSGHRPDRIRS